MHISTRYVIVAIILIQKWDYIETLITFTSGDQLRIACEEIVMEDM